MSISGAVAFHLMKGFVILSQVLILRLCQIWVSDCTSIKILPALPKLFVKLMREAFPDPPGSAFTNPVFYPPGRWIMRSFGKATFCGREAAVSVFISLSLQEFKMDGRKCHRD